MERTAYDEGFTCGGYHVDDCRNRQFVSSDPDEIATEARAIFEIADKPEGADIDEFVAGFLAGHEAALAA
jgi:hypothetical protein